jgi:non-heme chloroperoxidase
VILALDPAFLASRFREDGTVDLWPYDRLAAAAARIRVPTLVIRGSRSDVLRSTGADDLCRLIPHAEMIEVAGAGHMVAGDRNDRFATAVTGFVESITSGRSHG